MPALNCPYCHFPLPTQSHRVFLCSFGCRFAAFLKKSPRLFTMILLALSLMALSFLVSDHYTNWLPRFSPELAPLIRLILGFMMVGILGYFPFKAVFESMRNKMEFDSDLLFLLPVFFDVILSTCILVKEIATGIKLIDYPHFHASGMLLLVCYVLGYFESTIRFRVGQEMTRVMSLRPALARLLVKNQETEVAVQSLNIGDQVKVLPGEVIPCDGRIVTGTTSVDESMFTHEPSIYLKNKGDVVTGASLNRDGTIVVEMTQPLEKQFLATITEAFNRNIGGISRHLPPWAKRMYSLLAGIFSLSTGAALGAFLFFPRLLDPYAGFFLSILIVLSLFSLIRFLPVLHVFIIGRILQHGILVNSHEEIGKLARINTLFFDKTGTLTRGEFHTSNVFLERGVNQGTFLSSVFSLEAHSTHPLAKGVTTHPWHIEIPTNPVKDFASHRGLGVCGKICERGRPERFAAVGNQRFLKRFQMQISRAIREKVEELESTGETALLCGWEGQARGVISLSDTLRHDVKSLLDHLGDLDVEPILITGDHDEMISHLHVTHGLKQVYTRCLPEEKISKITKRKNKGNIVGMVGCPLDDPNVINKADVGMIMGTGTALPADHYGVIIFGRKFSKISGLIRYCRKITRIKSGSFYLIIFLMWLMTALSFLINPFSGWMAPALALVFLAFQTLPLKLLRTELDATFPASTH